jgi:hypothetical protein
VEIAVYVRNDPINRVDPDGRLMDFAVVLPPQPPLFDVAENETEPTNPMISVLDPFNNYFRTYGGGGGNTGTSFANAQAAFKSDAKNLAKMKLSQNCQNDLQAVGTTAAAIQAAASNVQFLNGVGSDVSMSSLYKTSPVASVRAAGSTQTGTVGSFIATHEGTVAVAQLGVNTVYLNAALINPNNYWVDMAIILHELLHNVSGLTDFDLQRDLGLPQSTVTDNITQKLFTDCF